MRSDESYVQGQIPASAVSRMCFCCGPSCFFESSKAQLPAAFLWHSLQQLQPYAFLCTTRRLIWSCDIGRHCKYGPAFGPVEMVYSLEVGGWFDSRLGYVRIV